MGRERDWQADVQGTNISFIRREKEHVLCEYEGFTFRVHRSNWPPKRLTPEVCTDPTGFFVWQCKNVHGETYDFSKVVYTKTDNKIIVTCRVHGDFEIRALSVKRGMGCNLCGYKSSGSKNCKTTEYFVEKAKAVHGDTYDYSLVKYTRAKDCVKIICKTHGVFEQMPDGHLAGKGCRACSDDLGSYATFLKSAEKSGVARLYLIRCEDENEVFLKVGITSKTITERFNSELKLPYTFSVVAEFQDSPENIFQKEQELHSILKEFKYVPKKAFGGMFECYNMLHHRQILEEVETAFI